MKFNGYDYLFILIIGLAMMEAGGNTCANLENEARLSYMAPVDMQNLYIIWESVSLAGLVIAFYGIMGAYKVVTKHLKAVTNHGEIT